MDIAAPGLPAAIAKFDEELTAMVGCGFTPLLALRTITAVTQYVTGFVLQEQADRQISADGPTEQNAEAWSNLPATLLVAIREGGGPLGEHAFAHGLRVLVDGTTTALSASADHPH